MSMLSGPRLATPVPARLKHVIVRIAAVLAVTLLLAPTRAQEVSLAVPEGHDPARAAALRAALENDLPYVPGEMLVRFKPGSAPRDQAAALQALRADVGPGAAAWIGDVLHLKGVDMGDPELAAVALRQQPEVLYAQPNYLRRLQSTPNDPEFGQQWHFNAINMPAAWAINPGGRADVLVAVIDSGVTTTNGTFGFPIWNGFAFQLFAVPMAKATDFDHARVRLGREFVFNWGWRSASTGETILFDSDGHGTHVAGTIAQQTNNQIGFAGIAYGVTLLPLKACWSYWDFQLYFSANGIPGWAPATAAACPDDAQAAAIRHAADEGAKVINLSVGGPGAAPAIADALRYAVSRGVFVAIAAGNEAERGNPTIYPAAYAPEIGGVVAVGALNRNSARAPYSSHGPYVELVAPGGDGGPPVNHVWQMGPNQFDIDFFRASPRYDRYQPAGKSGTSMAAPHVAGVAALLYSQGITNPAAIEAVLKRTARDLGPPGRDNEYGYGLIDARVALRGMGVAR
jgi:serine protease